jgi:heavy metal efflux system protein
VEQIHKVEEDHEGESNYNTINKAIQYLLPAMIGSSLSTIVIFIPFSLMSGVAGAFFKVLASTMVITLICSFFVTWLVLPLIYNLFSSMTKKKKAVVITHPKPKKWLNLFIARPILSVILAALMLVSVIFIYNNLETGFLPEMDEGSIVLDYYSPPGTSLDETNIILNEVDKIILSTPEVEAFTRRTGAQMGFFITEPNRGDYLIQLKNKRERSSNDVIDDMRQKIVSTQPGLKVDFGQVLGDMLGDLMSEPNPVEVKIFGNDPIELKKLAHKIYVIVKGVKGSEDVFNGINIAGPSVIFRPRSEDLLKFGLSPVDLLNQVTTRLRGNEVGSILENSQFIKMKMKYPPMENTLKNIETTAMFTPDGRTRELSAFTDIKIEEGVAEIERENLQRMISITASLSKRDLGSVIKEIQLKVDSQITLEKGQRVEYGGAYAQQQQSFKELLMILVSASLLVFIVLLFLFKDFKASLIILFLSILGVSGSFIALFITRTPLNVGSYTGIIMIVGIIAENSIFTFQQFAHHFKEASVTESINFAISARIRPKLMTASGAIIALMPLALGIGRGAQLHQPLAIAVIGGFCAALPLLLLVLPGLLKIFYKDGTSENQKTN